MADIHPTKNWQWPPTQTAATPVTEIHVGASCHTCGGMSEFCSSCGGTGRPLGPEAIANLRRDRDELVAALKDLLARLHGSRERADALLAPMKSR